MFKRLVFCLLLFCLRCAAVSASVETTCHRDADRNARVAACTEIIAGSRERRQLLRAYNTRGLALCDLGRCAEAVPDFEHVVALDHSIAGYFDNYARALREAGQLDSAMRAANRAVAMAPTYAFVFYGKAKVFEAMGSYGDALATLRQALLIEPRNAGVWEYAGKLQGLMKNYAAAYEAFQRSAEIEPDRIHLHLTRADVEIAEGDTDAAYHDLISYPQSGPDYKEAQQKLASIEEAAKAPDKPAPMPAVGSSASTTEREARETKERADKVEREAQAQRDLVEAQNREIAARKAKDDADADAKRIADQEAVRNRQIAEQRRKEDAAKKAETEPINVLTKAYAFYVIVKRCHEKRDGYATVWINDTELDRGRTEIKTVEAKLKEAGPLDTSAAWEAANQRADHISVLDDSTCHEALSAVDAEFKRADPQAAMTKKDF